MGSTGSIGRQGLQVIAEFPHLQAVALAAGSNWQLLSEQIRSSGARLVAVSDQQAAGKLKQDISDHKDCYIQESTHEHTHEIDLLDGPDAMSELVLRCDADILLSGVVGSCGLQAALTALERGMDLAIANKETLVMAGKLVTETARRHRCKLLPVDSEHSAIYQCLAGSEIQDVARVIITASGGPLRTWSAEKIANASVEEALAHPTWKMGPKITIDSATLMNKALEIIEAHWLFDLPAEKIHAVIHPESIIHSIVEFADGSQLAQMGWPDMTTPIAYALNYPHRLGRDIRRLNLFEAGKLTFEEIDHERFPAVELAYRVIREGQGAGAVFNAANEAAVEAFLSGRLRFGEIVPLVEETLNNHRGSDETKLRELLRADQWAREQVRKALGIRSS